jgi:hypothetical protein
MMISTLNFQFSLAQLALKFLGGLNLVLGGGAKARLAPRRTATADIGFVLVSTYMILLGLYICNDLGDSRVPGLKNRPKNFGR